MTEVLLYDSLPRELKEDLSRGQTRCRCPRCGGGSTREYSLDVRQADTGVIKLKCYRASCGWYGISVTEPNATLQRKEIKPPQPYVNPTIPIQGDIQRRLVMDYQIVLDVARDHGWRLSEHGEELVMPVLNVYGGERGHVTRTFSTPKRCYTFKATAQPWLDWWPQVDAKVVVIVEDCISACRLAGLGIAAIALLGTSMTVDQAKEIHTNARGRKVYLALDGDAFEKAIQICRRHGHILRMYPVYLQEDIKNIRHDREITNLFKG